MSLMERMTSKHGKRKDGKQRTYSKVVNYLLKTYVMDEKIAEAEMDFKKFM